MPIDARIPLGIEPSRSRSPQDAYSQAMQRQGQQQNMAIREAQLRKLREEEMYRGTSGYRKELQDKQDAADAQRKDALLKLTVAQRKEFSRLNDEAGRIMKPCLDAENDEEGARCFASALVSAKAQGIYPEDQLAELERAGWTPETQQKIQDAYEQTTQFAELKKELDKEDRDAKRQLAKERRDIELKHGQKISDEFREAQRKQFDIELKHGQKISDEFRAAQQAKLTKLEEAPGGAWEQFEKGFWPMWREANEKPDTATAKLEAWYIHKEKLLTPAELLQRRQLKAPTPKQLSEAKVKLTKARRDITKRYKDLYGEAMIAEGGYYKKGSPFNMLPSEADPSKGEDPAKSPRGKFADRLDELAKDREKEYAEAEEVYTSTTGLRSETAGSSAPGSPIDTDVPAGGGSVGVEGGNDPLGFR
jgi:hypothetical protein